MLAVHNTAPFKLVRAAAKYFRVKDGEPRVIINISSTSGIHGNAYVFFLSFSLSILWSFFFHYDRSLFLLTVMQRPG